MTTENMHEFSRVSESTARVMFATILEGCRAANSSECWTLLVVGLRHIAESLIQEGEHSQFVADLNSSQTRPGERGEKHE